MAVKKKSNWAIILNGLIKENPTLVLLLGTCPALAVSTSASNAVGMGLATMIALIGSNAAISLLKKVIPKAVRLPAYIVIISGFVTCIALFIEAYFPELHRALGLFLALIVVNCIILARAEVFASKNSVFASLCDGLGMGLGFMLALLLIGSFRELLGTGTWFGIPITNNIAPGMTFFIMAPGGFFVYGILTALINRLNGYFMENKKSPCDVCPMGVHGAGGAFCGKTGAPCERVTPKEADREGKTVKAVNDRNAREAVKDRKETKELKE